MSTNPARVLIAHQSTIPHYRVRFYELLEQMRPPDWTFEVVYDTRESSKPTIFQEPVDYRTFKFPILDTRTSAVTLAGRKIVWQHFITRAKNYDVLVTDTHLSNLSYPVMSLLRLTGKKRVFWGHTHDMNVATASPLKNSVERVKSAYVRNCDAFFAYTSKGAQDLIASGFPPGKVQPLNNTIDTLAEHAAFLSLTAQRNTLREQFGVTGKTVTFHVGRLRRGKRVSFLVDVITALEQKFPGKFHLFSVGSGEEEHFVQAAVHKLGSSAITHFGSLVDREQLAPVFTASDVFFMPGYLGLAPLQGFCYQLPLIAFNLPVHSPEEEYLTPQNSVLLNESTTVDEVAALFPALVQRFATEVDRAQIYESISQYTLEAMAQNFIAGINRVLDLGTVNRSGNQNQADV